MMRRQRTAFARRGPLLGLASLLIVVGLFSGGGCTYRPPSETFSKYPPREKKLDLKVALDLSRPLSLPKWESYMPVKDALERNSLALARHVFGDVSQAAPSSAEPAAAEAVLSPQLLYFVRTTPASGPAESIIAIKVEWVLRRPDGQLIWVQTVGGESRGTGFSDPTEMLGAALEDLFLRSEQAMVETPVIRQVVRRGP